MANGTDDDGTDGIGGLSMSFDASSLDANPGINSATTDAGGGGGLGSADTGGGGVASAGFLDAQAQALGFNGMPALAAQAPVNDPTFSAFGQAYGFSVQEAMQEGYALAGSAGALGSFAGLVAGAVLSGGNKGAAAFGQTFGGPAGALLGMAAGFSATMMGQAVQLNVNTNTFDYSGGVGTQ